MQTIPRSRQAGSLEFPVVVKGESAWERVPETVCALVQIKILAESKSKKHLTSHHSHLSFSGGLDMLGVCQTLIEVKQPQKWAPIGNFRLSLHIGRWFGGIEGEGGGCLFIQGETGMFTPFQGALNNLQCLIASQRAMKLGKESIIKSLFQPK